MPFLVLLNNKFFMKNILFIIAIVIFISTSCKTKQNISLDKKAVEQIAAKGITLGKISHQYKASGCATVIIINQQGQEKPITLIPKDKLPAEIDKDGTEVYFDYHTLRMKNPEGCNVGMPAEITNISKK